MRRILIVDDDVGIVDSLRELLQEDYDVLTAADGEHALRLLTRGSVDLLIVDMLMPILDGEGLMRELMARGNRTPVILVSAHRDLQNRAHGLGAACFLAKPFDVDQLEQSITRVLAHDRGGSSATWS